MQLQAVLRDSLSLQEPRDWKQLVIEALVRAFPGEAWEHGPLWEQGLPHALQAATWIRAERTLPDWSPGLPACPRCEPHPVLAGARATARPGQGLLRTWHSKAPLPRPSSRTPGYPLILMLAPHHAESLIPLLWPSERFVIFSV